ncbi:hypothetical protein FD754_004768 [Muntiacus muntjak]|uniref:PDZ domain-containing protein n=1 Tax=Muntiacus muntjak TaxID=9888 RepID=A0A5N3WFT4_MUNMU|nr:hypothetical protein FD754_004768 [Muntiacus muntjak]
MTTQQIVLQGPGPWVFHLLRGKDFEQPLSISWVTPGRKAAVGNLCVGDVITAIHGENTSNMTHLESQNKIKGCTDNMTLPAARPEQKIWSPLVTEEGKHHPNKMNFASESQEALRVGNTSSCSAGPFTTSLTSSSAARVITNQYNNPAGPYSFENISSFNNALESKTAASGQETNGKALDHSQLLGGLLIDKESEVYKMLQEKQEINEPLKQSTSFLSSGFRSVKALVTKLPVCDRCGTRVGVFMTLRDHHRHPVLPKGPFFVEDQIYCEKHAWKRVTPPEGYNMVTAFPK